MKIKLTPLIKIYKSTVNNTLYVMIRFVNFITNSILIMRFIYLCEKSVEREDLPV